MYMWYQQATECIVFLPDVARLEDRDNRADALTIQCDERTSLFDIASFVRSDWFRRGWTLQELLAPSTVLFYNTDFEYIGSKEDLREHIAEATQIAGWYLADPSDVRKATIATRMRWASRRQTTRQEDEAYCLLGLFGINMPLLYGEGRKSFVRLQLEIIKSTDDESIFAWEGFNSWMEAEGPWHGLLSPSPQPFANRSTSDAEIMRDPDSEYRHPYSMTNGGLKLTLEIPDDDLSRKHLVSTGTDIEPYSILLRLNCAEFSAKGIRAMAVKFGFHIKRDGRIMRGYRQGNLEYGPLDSWKSDEDNQCPFGNAEERGCCAVVDHERWDSETRVKKWKVYFPQDGT